MNFPQTDLVSIFQYIKQEENDMRPLGVQVLKLFLGAVWMISSWGCEEPTVFVVTVQGVDCGNVSVS